MTRSSLGLLQVCIGVLFGRWAIVTNYTVMTIVMTILTAIFVVIGLLNIFSKDNK